MIDTDLGQRFMMDGRVDRQGFIAPNTTPELQTTSTLVPDAALAFPATSTAAPTTTHNLVASAPINMQTSGEHIGQTLAQTSTARATSEPTVTFSNPVQAPVVTNVTAAGLAQQEIVAPQDLGAQVEAKLTAFRQALTKFGPAERHLLTHMKENSPKALLLKALFLLPVAWMLVLQLFNHKPSPEAQSNMASAAKALGELSVVLKSDLEQSMNPNFIRTVLTETTAPVNRNATKTALAAEIKTAYSQVPGTDLEAFITRASTGDLKQQIIGHVFDTLISDRLSSESAVEAKTRPNMDLKEAFRLVSRFMKVQEKLAKESGVFARFMDPMRGVYDKVVKVFKDSQDGMQAQLLKGLQGLSGDVTTAVQQVANAVGQAAPGVIQQAADALGAAATKQRANQKSTTAV